MGRGVVQLSGWVDLVLASFLFEGAVAALGYAQTFYMLPVSLFGMSIAASELPELSAQEAARRNRCAGASRRDSGRWPSSSCRRPSATCCSAT
jgi:putative peptidoglycan lipid II flippase